MSKSRKGLKRHGMSAYLMTHAGTSYILRRIGSRKWVARRDHMPDVAYDFFGICFTTLAGARKWAFDQIFPGKCKPRIRRRRGVKSDPRALVLAAKKIAEERAKDGPK